MKPHTLPSNRITFKSEQLQGMCVLARVTSATGDALELAEGGYSWLRGCAANFALGNLEFSPAKLRQDVPFYGLLLVYFGAFDWFPFHRTSHRL